MEDETVFTILWVVSVILACIVAIFFFFYVRALTLEYLQKHRPDQLQDEQGTSGTKKKKSRSIPMREWCRFLAPVTCLVILGFFSMDVRMNLWGHVGWILLVSILVPWGFTWLGHRDIVAKRWDRVTLILALICLFNLLTLTAGWAYERRSQLRSYHGKGIITQATPEVSSKTQEATNRIELQIRWPCEQEQQQNSNNDGYCYDALIKDCNVNQVSSRRYDYDMKIYPQYARQNSFQGCDKGFYKLYSDDDAFIQPYMSIVGDCYYCEVDKHSAGHLYRAVKYMIFALLAVTVVFFALHFFLRFQRLRRFAAVDSTNLVGNNQGTMA